MNNTKKIIGLLAVLYCYSLAFCCDHRSDPIRRQFEQLRRERFENTTVFKEKAEHKKTELEQAKKLVQEERVSGYKDRAEALRLEIDSIGVMLLVIEKIEQYKKDGTSITEKSKIKEKLQGLAAYYPIVRGAVRETIGDE